MEGREMLHSPTLAAVGVFALVAIGHPALAETMMFKADLKGANEAPPTDSGGQGNAMLTLDTAGKTVSWKVVYKGLTGDATAADFHGPADSGANAGPAVDISGKIEEGSASVTDQQIADIQSIKWYLNIHTAKYPDGEIRGQLEPAK
jgi:hypothetical protein